jgi:hypothetical protein
MIGNADGIRKNPHGQPFRTSLELSTYADNYFPSFPSLTWERQVVSKLRFELFSL